MSLVVLGNPLVDISLDAAEDLLRRYGLEPDDSVEIGRRQQGIVQDLLATPGVRQFPGGTALNTALTANWVLKDQEKVSFAGILGNDALGLWLQDQLRVQNLRTFFKVVDGGQTGVVAIIVTPDGKRSMCSSMKIAKYLDENFLFSEQIQEAMNQSSIIYIVGYTLIHNLDLMLKLGKYAQQNNKKIALNLSAPFIPRGHYEKLKMFLPFVDILIGNLNEGQVLLDQIRSENGSLGIHWLHELSQVLKESSKSIIVLTNGAWEVVATDGGDPITVPVDPVPNVVDTTGAGDAFAGGFLALHLQGNSLDRSVQGGIACARAMVQKQGCTPPSFPYSSLL